MTRRLEAILYKSLYLILHSENNVGTTDFRLLFGDGGNGNTVDENGTPPSEQPFHILL